ncbi:MAG: 4Fe-4S binding protein [Deltaproteobacteria bacterium]|nr:4Fe-4S binding protein [Deltaproteobacteria bacterium]MBW2070358.1 4Fe-4S binding protein [Deltaproteobacteria bacterium]
MAKKRDHFTVACATLMRGEAGKTGEWRFERPVVDHSKCISAKTGKQSCFLCWLYCPEACIDRKAPVEIDLVYCKGCGICAEECPADAIHMETEEQFLDVLCDGEHGPGHAASAQGD